MTNSGKQIKLRIAKCMSIPSELLEKIITAYQGEVYGQALFTTLANNSKIPSQRDIWQLMVQLELVIQADLKKWLAQHGYVANPDLKSWQQGVDEAHAISTQNWLIAMQWLYDITAIYVKRYDDMNECEFLTEEDSDAKVVLQRLADHEKALYLYAQAQLNSDAESTKVAESLIRRLLPNNGKVPN